ncbi:hypothetical protein RclHR1_09640002 [Rhizophagus clarus]|uniref:Uncharacterized protein n=1 Tax=Rhizophagus clarus TaxID=94130 RepID=A0A2Z6S742_9GLOM|nr:hypothetical protein RclHR1_09640002 [Rhizophagus clarus]
MTFWQSTWKFTRKLLKNNPQKLIGSTVSSIISNDLTEKLLQTKKGCQKLFSLLYQIHTFEKENGLITELIILLNNVTIIYPNSEELCFTTNTGKIHDLVIDHFQNHVKVSNSKTFASIEDLPHPWKEVYTPASHIQDI